MLSLPTQGLRRSVDKHNVDLQVLADWAEASVLFSDDIRLTQSEVTEELVAENYYDDSDFCSKIVEALWGTLRERKYGQGGLYPIDVGRRRIDGPPHWTESPLFSFCLLLSLVSRVSRRTSLAWGLGRIIQSKVLSLSELPRSD